MSIKAHIICHTHWDREWYLTKEEFRTKLVRLIDGLLEVVEEVPEYVSFMLDGQTIAIEDYLEIKPYNRDRLFAALKSGKIICGPWYILPDELLISGESHIRNYIKGTQVVSEIGQKMETAYLPDSFGHPAQMPQIIEGLGMHTMVFWRGLSKEVEKTEFYWESPFTKSSVLCIHMPHGYGNSGNLSSNMENTVPRVRELMESLGAKSTTDVVLLMNGSDHIIGQKDICSVVKQMNEAMPEYQFELSTMENYLSEVKENLKDLATYRGEFRSGERSMLLGGTISTRMYLKQKNDIVQNKAERYLEPILALEKLCGQQYDSQGYMDYIWKKILENHPHDSICGCSIDEVHREMMTRYACVEQLEDTLVRDAVLRCEGTQEEKGRRKSLFLFEPTTNQRPSYAEIDISMDEMLVQSVNFTKSIIEDFEAVIEHPDVPAQIRITDEEGRVIPHVILHAKKDYEKLYQDHTMPEVYKVNKIHAAVLLPGFTMGCHQLFVEPVNETQQAKEAVIHNADVIENDYYRLQAKQDGLHLLDKRTRRVHDNFARLIDTGDAGDEYTYSWPQEDREYTVDYKHVKIKTESAGALSQTLIVTGELNLPRAVTEDRKKREEDLLACPFTMKFTLSQGISRIDCHMEFDNQAKDHRLQVQFPSGICTDNSQSYHIFNITKRPVALDVPDEWMEYPQAQHPSQGYVGVWDDKEGMSVGTKGLPEYEAVQTDQGTAVNVTLLRCVGWLSRTDLCTRHGNGGWTIETKEGQCLGTHSFDFCVVYHDVSCKEAFADIEKFRLPSYIQGLKSTELTRLVQNQQKMFEVPLGEGICLSALKIAENQRDVILRLFSIEEKERELNLNVPLCVKKVFQTNLAEEKICEKDIKNGSVICTVQPHQIITLCMEL